MRCSAKDIFCHALLWAHNVMHSNWILQWWWSWWWWPHGDNNNSFFPAIVRISENRAREKFSKKILPRNAWKKWFVTDINVCVCAYTHHIVCITTEDDAHSKFVLLYFTTENFVVKFMRRMKCEVCGFLASLHNRLERRGHSLAWQAPVRLFFLLLSSFWLPDSVARE